MKSIKVKNRWMTKGSEGQRAQPIWFVMFATNLDNLD